MPIPLPTPAHAAAFRSLADWIASDGELKRVTRVVRSWQGAKDEDALPAALTQLPWLRLTPEMQPIEPFALLGAGLRSFRSPLRVTVETAHAGSDAADSVKLWDRIFDRVMAWDHEAASVSWVTPERPAQATNDSDFTVATGAFVLDLYVTG